MQCVESVITDHNVHFLKFFRFHLNLNWFSSDILFFASGDRSTYTQNKSIYLEMGN